MTTPEKTVISASRRTDIPAFYMPWFMESIDRGAFEVINPYNRKTRVVPVSPEQVHTVVFWSKNFGPFLSGKFGNRLEKLGYHLFFNFTVNSENPILEPNVPPLQQRLDQMKALCSRFPAEAVVWRFDPLCFFSLHGKPPENNLNDFSRIAETAAECGIRRCITSFMDDYAKIRRRTAALGNFAFVDPPLEKKQKILLKMEALLTQCGIRLHTCCEKKVLESLPASSEITAASCIPNDLLMNLYGGRLSLRKDAGQRARQGCGCKVSVDIGSYDLHPCYHRCLFCYANPAR